MIFENAILSVFIAQKLHKISKVCVKVIVWRLEKSKIISQFFYVIQFFTSLLIMF